MSRDKQIEERMKITRDICPFYKEYGTCEQCNKDLDIDDEPCYWDCMANAIIHNGYRKASDVAREIIDILREIQNDLQARYEFWEASSIRFAIGQVEYYAEKKYESED